MILDGLFLLAAGFAGGMLNSIAGGGSFITFPALILVGLPPVSANATNTFASCAGYLSGTYAFREDLRQFKNELPRFILLSLTGGAIGAWLLLTMPESLFSDAIPWLLLFATLLFIFGSSLNQRIKRLSRRNKSSATGLLLLTMMLLAVAIYGGFFNAGLGIVILSYLALAGYADINAMNGLKLLVSSAVSLIAILVFIADGVIAWTEGGVVLIGSLLGGYFAAKYSRLLPQSYVRGFVVVASIAITVYFFLHG